MKGGDAMWRDLIAVLVGVEGEGVGEWVYAGAAVVLFHVVAVVVVVVDVVSN